MSKYILPDKDIVAIADHVCTRMYGTPEQMEEYFCEALMGIAIALNTFDPERGVKLSTYCYSKAYWQVKSYQSKMRTKSRGYGYVTLSLDELAEKGFVISDQHELMQDEL